MTDWNYMLKSLDLQVYPSIYKESRSHMSGKRNAGLLTFILKYKWTGENQVDKENWREKSVAN